MDEPMLDELVLARIRECEEYFRSLCMARA